jgi:CubicO group peptidase (beta-lactamase class C family)
MKMLAGLLLLSALPVLAQAPATSATPAPPAAAEVLSADTPKATVAGNTFIAPAGWSVSVRGPATVLASPEGDSWIALVDVQGKDADAAVAAAWAAYKPDAKWPLKVTNDIPDRNGWSRQKGYDYQTSPNEKRTVQAIARSYGAGWTVAIIDVADAVMGKRGSQVGLIFDRLLPKGYQRESFAGKKAHELDKARIDELGSSSDGSEGAGRAGRRAGDRPGRRVVFSGGFGVRELGKTATVDGDTVFMIASNTKALTTLLLAKLVAEGKLTWDTPVTSLLPSFKLGDAETTRQVKVRQLICACTGMPRQDLEWLFEFKDVTPEKALVTLGPCSRRASSASSSSTPTRWRRPPGYTAGHVMYPQMELGAAYDKAMQTQVFDPLGMKATTFDYARALAGDHAYPHSPDIDGKPALAVMELNYSIIPQRPAGAAWSNVNDMLRYVSMELANGALPDGKTYIPKEPLLERRAAQVPIGKDETYGWDSWWTRSTRSGRPSRRRHDRVSQRHDLAARPERRGRHPDERGPRLDPPRASSGASSSRSSTTDARGGRAGGRAGQDVLRRARRRAEADDGPAGSPRRAPSSRTAYSNPALGEIAVSRKAPRRTFDFGEWKSPMASAQEPGRHDLVSDHGAGLEGFEFVVGSVRRRPSSPRRAARVRLRREVGPAGRGPRLGRQVPAPAGPQGVAPGGTPAGKRAYRGRRRTPSRTHTRAESAIRVGGLQWVAPVFLVDLVRRIGGGEPLLCRRPHCTARLQSDSQLRRRDRRQRFLREALPVLGRVLLRHGLFRR